MSQINTQHAVCLLKPLGGLCTSKKVTKRRFAHYLNDPVNAFGIRATDFMLIAPPHELELGLHTGLQHSAQSLAENEYRMHCTRIRIIYGRKKVTPRSTSPQCDPWVATLKVSCELPWTVKYKFYVDPTQINWYGQLMDNRLYCEKK